MPKPEEESQEYICQVSGVCFFISAKSQEEAEEKAARGEWDDYDASGAMFADRHARRFRRGSRSHHMPTDREIEIAARAMQASKAWPAVFQAGTARELAIAALKALEQQSVDRCEHGLDRDLCGVCSIHLEVR